jgi:methyl-accepting chemotaxis protein
MFPNWFTARVAERMVVWCGLLGFVLFLYGAVEVLQASRMADILQDRQSATAALLTHVADDAAPAGRSDKRAELGKAIANRIQTIDERQSALHDSHRQNQLLIGLLALFVAVQILLLEYRWLVRPIVRIAAVLQSGQAAGQSAGPASWRDLATYAPRRDEIGIFAQALMTHFQLVECQREVASLEQAGLSERLSRQDSFRQESMSFQASIAEIVQRLEGHAGRMSSASNDLVSISSAADARAEASVQSTERISDHVDGVASAIHDIATTFAEVVGEAERTSAVAAAARSLVAAAKEDVNALTEAARTIEPVIALIQHVANQTNLLALNATIEAARAGEMGRGFGVVALEVKQLATRTARATEDVRGGLQGIAAASSRIVERVGKLFDSIEQVDAVSAAIADSMRRQDTNSQAITTNTKHAAADVRDVAATVKQVAAMIAEAKQGADLVTKASADLGQQAADLRLAVVRFIETTERMAA